MEQTFGSWYVRGGMRALATAVYERCRERKVAFVFDAPVREVLARAGRAAGLLLADGTEAAADHVVCGIDPRQLDVPLPPGGVPARGEGTASRLTLLLALRGARSADAVHRTLVHSPGGPVTVLQPEDPGLWPDAGHEAVTVSAVCAAAGRAPAAGPDAEALLDLAARAVPDLRERMLWCEVRTPADIEAATGAAGCSTPPTPRPCPGCTSRAAGRIPAGGWRTPG